MDFSKLIKKTADAFKLNYDAVVSKQRRRQNPVKLSAEDRVLVPKDRDKLVSEARTLRRNASVVAWAIRNHLKYVATFSFQAKTGNPELDDQIEKLVKRWSRPENFDASGRHSMEAFTRLLEGHATTDGDAFVYKLDTGHVQLIEGDRVRTPSDLGEYKDRVKPEDFVHGIQTNAEGRALRYAICDRDGEKFVLKTLADAEHVLHHGYFDRYDQIRGISPLASAINTFCDIYEASEYALAKMKLSQLFAVKLKLEGESDEADTASYKFGEGPQTIELGTNEDASFLESSTPSNEFQAFMTTGIAIGLKSLDIPMSFYDEAHTNYSGSRIALLAYEQSAEIKRHNVRQLLSRLTRWRLQLFVDAGELVLPADTTVDDLVFEFVSIAVPWIDPQKEATANQMLVDQKLASRQQIAKERGQDWYDIVDQLSDEEAYLEKKGFKKGKDGAAADAGADIKAVFDAFGSAVRAGAITPLTDDEDYFRAKLGVPPKGPAVGKAWEHDGGVRRPVTLAVNEENTPVGGGDVDEPVATAA